MPRRIASSASLFLLVFLSLLRCHAGTFVEFRTSFGTIEVELYDQDKPATVKNFLHYVRTGAYQEMFLHRCVPNFVVQGGGYTATNRTLNALMDNNTISPCPRFPAVTNEYSVGRRFSNVYGTIAMARVGGATNSATSEWFFNTANNLSLDTVDGGFTVFGRVVRGTNVLNFFNSLRYTNGLIDLRYFVGNNSFGNLFKELPVTRAGFFDPPLPALVYCDISLLSVRVAPAAAGGKEVTWNSILGRPNRVEYTTAFPPQWTTLVVTNGTGTNLTVLDPDGAATRFYRVQVEY